MESDSSSHPHLDAIIYIWGGHPVQVGGSADAICSKIDELKDVTGVAVVYCGVAGFVTEGDVPSDQLFAAALIKAIDNGRHVAPRPELAIPLWESL